jgi:hypothetical protein
VGAPEGGIAVNNGRRSQRGWGTRRTKRMEHQCSNAAAALLPWHFFSAGAPMMPLSLRLQPKQSAWQWVNKYGRTSTQLTLGRRSATARIASHTPTHRGDVWLHLLGVRCTSAPPRQPSSSEVMELRLGPKASPSTIPRGDRRPTLLLRLHASRALPLRLAGRPKSAGPQ